MGIVIALLLLTPNPFSQETDDDGTTSMSSILPIYEIYTYDTVCEMDVPPGVQGGTVHKTGFEIRLFGMPVHTRINYEH